jgi:hypothetical protein
MTYSLLFPPQNYVYICCFHPICTSTTSYNYWCLSSSYSNKYTLMLVWIMHALCTVMLSFCVWLFSDDVSSSMYTTPSSAVSHIPLISVGSRPVLYTVRQQNALRISEKQRIEVPKVSNRVANIECSVMTEKTCLRRRTALYNTLCLSNKDLRCHTVTAIC